MRNTARGLAPLGATPAKVGSTAEVPVAEAPRAAELEPASSDDAEVPSLLVARRIPPTREHAWTPPTERADGQPARLRASARTLIRGTDAAPDPEATRISRPPVALLREATPQEAKTSVGKRPEFTRPAPVVTFDPDATVVAPAVGLPGSPALSPPEAAPGSAPVDAPSRRPRRKALELMPDADEGLVERESGSPNVPGSNRRTSERLALSADIGMHSATQFFTGLGGDISHGGLFVATWSPLPLGTEVTVSFVLPGGHQVTAPGRVAWLKEPRDRDSDETPGMGVRFTALTGEDRRAIDRFLERRPALFHEV